CARPRRGARSKRRRCASRVDEDRAWSKPTQTRSRRKTPPSNPAPAVLAPCGPLAMIASTMALRRSPAFAAMYRLPLWFHRRGIRGYERILGIDWLVLTTRGRRTGTPRTVMLDVIGHDEARDVWYVQPADGRRSNWVQNLLANPEATVEVRGRQFQARATEVTGAEGADVVL